MIPNIEYKIIALSYEYGYYIEDSEDGYGDLMTFRQYVERKAKNDENFWYWIYEHPDVLPDEDQRMKDLQELFL